MKFSLVSLYSICCATAFSQDITVPDSIKKEIVDKSFELNSKNYVFKVVYPENYDSTKTYPLFLGISGGNQSPEIVDYCYAAWFKNNVFKNHLTILPLNIEKGSFENRTSEEITQIISVIKQNFKIEVKNGVLAATSNGGVAAFKFIECYPTLFNKVFVMPGYISENIIPTKKWKKINFIFAYGEKDAESWKLKSMNSIMILAKFKVRKARNFEIKAQDHILTLDYDINEVYNLLK